MVVRRSSFHRRAKVRGPTSIASTTGALCLMAGAVVAGLSPIAKADQGWTGAAGDTLFNTPTNWNGSAVPGTSDIAIFNDPAAQGVATTVYLNNSDESVAGFLFNNTATTTIYSGIPGSGTTGTSFQTIYMSGGMTVGASAGAVTFGIPGPLTLDNFGTAANMVGFAIVGSQSIINNSGNQLTFGGTVGSNSFVSGGTSGIDTLTFDGAGAGVLVNGSLQDANGSQLAIIKNGTATLEIDGSASNFTGGLTLNAGYLYLRSGNAFDSGSTTNTVTINGGGLAGVGFAARTIPAGVKFVIGGDFSLGVTSISDGLPGVNLNIQGPVDLGGATRTITTVTDTQAFNGGVSSGGIIKMGSGTLVIGNGGSTYSGPTIIDAGTFSSGSATANNTFSPNSAFTVNGGALALTGNVETIGSLAGSGVVKLGTGGQLVVGNDNTSTTFNGSITGSGTNASNVGLLKIGSGTLALAGSGNISGLGTTIGASTNYAGTLSIISDANLGNNADAVNIYNGALLANATFSSSRAMNLNDAASTIDATAGHALTLTGPLTGSGNLTKGTNSGTLQLAQTSGYTLGGNVNADGGLLAFGATSSFTSTPNGPLVIGGGLSDTVNITGALTINAGAKVSLNPSIPGTSKNNSVGSLSIGDDGVLDIGNHSVVVQSAPTESVIGGYLANGYHGGFWNGASVSGGAINSVVAFNDNSGATSIGYGNSSDFTFGGSISPYRVGGPKALSGNQVVVAPAMAGDLLLAGSVGPNELSLLLNSFGTTGNDWALGNIDYDPAGSVGPNDLSLLLANFGHSSAGFAGADRTAKSLSSTAKPNLVASGADDLGPPPADSMKVFIDYENGDVVIEGNNANLVTSVVLTSPRDGLTGGTTFTPSFHALFDTSASNTNGLIDQFNTFTNGSAVDGLVDMGDVYNTIQNDGDIQFQFSEKGVNRGGLLTGVVVYFSPGPEPASLSLLAVASAGLLGRRRKRRIVP